MRLLGLDYGRSRIGLAIAVGSIIDTRGFLDYKKLGSGVFDQIKALANQEKIDKIIIGVSSGKIRTEINRFVSQLKEVVGLPVEQIDETLTSFEAEQMVGWKDKGKIDSISAALILQRYLDF